MHHYRSQKLRVAVLGLRGIPEVQGGIERHCQELYPRMAKYGYEVTIVARKGYVQGEPYEYNGVRVKPLWAPRIKSLEAICHTAIGICWIAGSRKDFDIVHIHAVGPSLLAFFVRILGFKLVVTNHGPDYDREKWGRPAKYLLRLGERLGTKYGNSVIAVSKHIKDHLYEKYGTQAVYIPNGVNTAKPGPAVPTLSSFGLKAGRYILAVGRLVPEKGFHDLIDAYEKLHTDWKLAIVGSADHKDSYSNNLIKRAGKLDGLIFTGLQKGSSLRELYSNAGLFVLPSYHEGLPIVALEAMSYNLPMLISDIPANMEVALPEELFPVRNVEALSRCLHKFLEDPSLLMTPDVLSAKKRRLKFEFNWDLIANQTSEIFRAVVYRQKTNKTA